MEHLEKIASVLVNNSVSSNTNKTYKTALEKFASFRRHYEFDDLWPVSVRELILFVAYLANEGLAVTTVSTYMSAISP